MWGPVTAPTWSSPIRSGRSSGSAPPGRCRTTWTWSPPRCAPTCRRSSCWSSLTCTRSRRGAAGGRAPRTTCSWRTCPRLPHGWMPTGSLKATSPRVPPGRTLSRTLPRRTGLSSRRRGPTGRRRRRRNRRRRWRRSPRGPSSSRRPMLRPLAAALPICKTATMRPVKRRIRAVPGTRTTARARARAKARAGDGTRRSAAGRGRAGPGRGARPAGGPAGPTRGTRRSAGAAAAGTSPRVRSGTAPGGRGRGRAAPAMTTGTGGPLRR
mmetsp:Transcript_41570/g.70114  ORF Transcript_41570/g.70114 Transcript_41570/m.70114 type:complete len:267 (+) Transcript_41570:3258-4058(+)